MLALALWRQRRCPICGRDMDECTDPDSDGKWTVPAPTRCHATTALAVAQAKYQEQPQREALLWRVGRR